MLVLRGRFGKLRSLGASALVTALMVAFAPAASAATVNVDVVNSDFNPNSVKVKIGDSVQWTFVDSFSHTATDTTGISPKIFNSGSKSDGATFVKQFKFAASIPYRCEIHHSMTGTVKIPVKLTKLSNGNIRVTWAQESANTGFNYDVQVKKPGDANYVNLVQNTQLPSLEWNPTGTGTFRFRARFQQGTGAATNYSPAKAITI